MKLILMMAITADGKIARDSNHFPDWTGKADKRMFKQLTTAAGVIIMGSRTFDTIGKPLPNRLNVVMTRCPERYTAGRHLFFTSESPADLLAGLKGRGYKEAILIGGATINTLFVQAGLIDEILVTIVPVMFGTGLSLFSERLASKLELIDAHEVEPGFLVVKYKVL